MSPVPPGKLLAVPVAVLLRVGSERGLVRRRRPAVGKPATFLVRGLDLVGEVLQCVHKIFESVCLEVQQEPVSAMWARHVLPLAGESSSPWSGMLAFGRSHCKPSAACLSMRVVTISTGSRSGPSKQPRLDETGKDGVASELGPVAHDELGQHIDAMPLDRLEVDREQLGMLASPRACSRRGVGDS